MHPLDPANPVALPLSMLIVFGAAKLLNELCERLGQPGVAGEIVAGILVGPAVLEWIAPHSAARAAHSQPAYSTQNR